MKEASVKEVVEAFYESRLANDAERCLEHMAANANIRIAGSPKASPIAASSNNTESLRGHVSELVGGWEWHSQNIESITIQGERAAVHFRLNTTFKPTGDIVNSELLDLITVRGGKIVSFVEFVDTALVARLAAKRAR